MGTMLREREISIGVIHNRTRAHFVVTVYRYIPGRCNYFAKRKAFFSPRRWL